MAKEPKTEGHAKRPQTFVLRGRLARRENGICQIELVEGLTVDVHEDDCAHIKEKTDEVTLRSMVAVEVKGNKPIRATFQPHLYQVLAHAGPVPFTFAGASKISPDQVETPGVTAALQIGNGGGGGGGNGELSMGETATRSQDWFEGWINDDNTIDNTDDEGWLL